jgi:DNA-binding NtrC family response regulator
MHEIERRMLFKTLAYFGNNKARTAQALGITTKTIYNRLHAYRAAGHGDVAGNDPDNGHDDA